MTKDELKKQFEDDLWNLVITTHPAKAMDYAEWLEDKIIELEDKIIDLECQLSCVEDELQYGE